MFFHIFMQYENRSGCKKNICKHLRVCKDAMKKHEKNQIAYKSIMVLFPVKSVNTR